jgi:8-oxo-dGTP pyrophosphatase MutT (NUDIX family)
LGLAINQEGRYLVTLRQDHTHPQYDHCWQIPGGGLEPGEQPVDTLNRELLEEVGVTPTLLFPHPMVAIRSSDGGHRLILMCYLISIGSQRIKLDGIECTQYKWITTNHISAMKFLPMSDTFVRNAHTLRMQHGLDGMLK